MWLADEVATSPTAVVSQASMIMDTPGGCDPAIEDPTTDTHAVMKADFQRMVRRYTDVVSTLFCHQGRIYTRYYIYIYIYIYMVS